LKKQKQQKPKSQASKKRPSPDDRSWFFVTTYGAPAVGIEGHEAQVLLWVHVDDLGFVKSTLAEAFQKIWGEKRVNVLTEAECDEEA
jgi:hypothetical protein